MFVCEFEFESVQKVETLKPREAVEGWKTLHIIETRPFLDLESSLRRSVWKNGKLSMPAGTLPRKTGYGPGIYAFKIKKSGYSLRSVAVKVALWGMVVTYQTGFMAQHAEILEIHESSVMLEVFKASYWKSGIYFVDFKQKRTKL